LEENKLPFPNFGLPAENLNEYLFIKKEGANAPSLWVNLHHQY
jgi:hypothetical protein